MFTKIDINNWERADRYNHFMDVTPCVYNITANLDITNLLKLIKAKNLKLYPSLIYMLGRVVNSCVELRLAHNQNGELGYYDICHPSYTVSNAVPTSFSGIWSWYYEDFNVFYNYYIGDTALFSQAKDYAPKPNQPSNTYYVSCAKDIAFTSLDLHLYKGESNLTPMFTFGKYFSQGERIVVPLASCLHHATCDGYHVAKIYKQLQQLADDCASWLKI